MARRQRLLATHGFVFFRPPGAERLGAIGYHRQTIFKAGREGAGSCCGATFYTPERAVTKQAISTEDAPQAIGTYSQAVQAGGTIYLSGQIGLDPANMQVVDGIDAQIHRALGNLRAVAAASGASLDDVVKVTVFLTDLANFARLNEIMAEYFRQPFPARSAVGVSQLPRGALVEIEAILVKP
jgi:reactive intermediate/imine deaminase